jgi:hypothetical protein
MPVSVSSWIQNAGSVMLSGQALAGVAITSQSVSLSGDLVLDVGALDVYDGMTFTLINASSRTHDLIQFSKRHRDANRFFVKSTWQIFACAS